MDISLPVSKAIVGTVISHSTGNSNRRAEYQAAVRESFRTVLPDPHLAYMGPVAVTILLFWQYQIAVDVDNAAKTILDALSGFVLGDDRQVRRLLVQSFEPGSVAVFPDPDVELAFAIAHKGDVAYVRISSDLYEHPFESKA